MLITVDVDGFALIINYEKQVVIAHFKNDARFTSIILVGHSQGSLLAMTASKNADKYISVAGAGENPNLSQTN